MHHIGFWHKRDFLNHLLRPLGFIYHHISQCRQTYLSKRAFDCGKMVICVGGATIGGAGKTPFVSFLAKTYQNQHPLAVILRGYKKKSKNALCVDVKQHTAQMVGDEAFMLAQSFPKISVLVGSHRPQLAQTSIAQTKNMIILDDGLQNPSLERNINILVVDGATGFGNGLVLPAGPLREPISTALIKCQAVIILNRMKHTQDRQDITQLRQKATERNIMVLDGTIKPTLESNNNTKTNMATKASMVANKNIIETMNMTTKTERKEGLGAKTYFAYCAIGMPEKFFHSLDDLDIKLIGKQIFPDHHMLNQKEARMLLELAKDAEIITTQKDFVKLPSTNDKTSLGELARRTKILKMELDIPHIDQLTSLINKHINKQMK